MTLHRAPAWPGPAYTAGIYPLAGILGVAVTPSAVNLLLLRRFRVRAPVVPASFGVRTVTGGAGSSFKCGIWLDAARVPVGTPIMWNDTGETTAINNTFDLATVTGVVMSPLVDYWFGATWTGTRPTVVSCANTDLEFADFLGVGALSTVGAMVTGYSTPLAYADPIDEFDITGATLTAVLTTNTPLPQMGVA